MSASVYAAFGRISLFLYVLVDSWRRLQDSPYSALSLVRQWIHELFEFSAMLGSTVALGDDFLELFVLSAMLGSTVALGDDFRIVSVFSAELGSTVDTCRLQSTRRL